MATKKNKTIRLIIATLVLLLILVVLPLGSWYYLKNGLDYRITTMGQLQDFGQLPPVAYATFSDKTIENTDLEGKVVVTNVLDFQDETLASTWGNVLQKLHDQFDERQDVVFLLHVTDVLSAEAEAFAGQYELKDFEQCHFIPTKDFGQLEHNYYLGRDSLSTHFTLIDTKSKVRKHYDVRDEEQVKRLVEHMALLLPLQKKEEISLKREREK